MRATLQGVSPEGEHGRKYFHVGKPLSETKCSAYGYHLLQVCGYAYVYAYVYVYVYVYVCVYVCVSIYIYIYIYAQAISLGGGERSAVTRVPP